jgi:hypothetical protein
VEQRTWAVGVLVRAKVSRLLGDRLPKAGIILTGRDSARLGRAASELGPLPTAAFDASCQGLRRPDLELVRRVVGPPDVGAHAEPHEISVPTGATHDIDGGEQLVSGS